jgi:1-phosphofructokinase
MSQKVITVTLNPSLDRTLVTHYLSVGYHNRTSETTRLDPAGRGVSIARALKHLGITTHSVIGLGDDATGYAYQALIAKEQLPVTFIQRNGLTRSNVVILDTGNQTETSLIEESAGISPENLEAVKTALRSRIESGDLVVFAGSLPNETPNDMYARLIEVAREMGAQTVVSVTPEALPPSLEAAPYMVALTQNEAEGYFNHPVRTADDRLYCSQKLQEKGTALVLTIAQEEGAATLSTPDGSWYLTYPSDDETGTRSGVKEAVLAGFLAGLVQGRDLPAAFQLGGAAASYTSTQIGSEFGALEDLEAFTAGVQVEPVALNA